jgi:hypothetical protein
MSNRTQYRIDGRTLTPKQWAAEWGCTENAARHRLYTLCGHRKAFPVRRC